MKEDYGVNADAPTAVVRPAVSHGTPAVNEAGVRFVEICQPGWDHHNNLHKPA